MTDEDYTGTGSYEDALEGRNYIETENLTLEELVQESQDKIITDYNKVRNAILEARIYKEDEEGNLILDDNGEKIVIIKKLDFDYKALKKRTFIKAQATQDEEKTVDMILTSTLWKPSKNRFWTLDEINKGIPVFWQLLMVAKIVEDSGLMVSKLSITF